MISDQFLHLPKGLVKPLEPPFRFCHTLGGEINRAAVMTRQEEQAQNLRLVTFQHLSNGEEVAERLGHFFLIYVYESIVHPVVGETGPKGGFRLGDLVLMVRKNKVFASSVNIKTPS